MTRSLQLDAQVEVTPKLIDLNTDAGINQFLAELESEFDYAAPRSAKEGDVLMIQMSNVNDATKYLGSPFRKLDDARAVVLDLRGSGGGTRKGFEDLTSYFIDKKSLVGLALKRDEIDTIRVEPDDAFTGPLVIIIDSRTAGAAEMFARVMQLRGRAKLIGDQSAGTGHLSSGRLHGVGTGRVVPYGLSMSIADLRLADGRTLERHGVVPDELLLPTPADLAAGRDPVLARAVALVGGSLDPIAAGKLFRPQWKK
jgi:carboxyl-terminal processing protease